MVTATFDRSHSKRAHKAPRTQHMPKSSALSAASPFASAVGPHALGLGPHATHVIAPMAIPTSKTPQTFNDLNYGFIPDTTHYSGFGQKPVRLRFLMGQGSAFPFEKNHLPTGCAWAPAWPGGCSTAHGNLAITSAPNRETVSTRWGGHAPQNCLTT